MHAYRIGTAARLSGVDAVTIRNWERRYRVLAAARTSGNQRLYTAQDIESLRWLRQAIASGLSAGEAHGELHARRLPDRVLAAAPGVRQQSREIRESAAFARARSTQVLSRAAFAEGAAILIAHADRRPAR